MTDYQALIDVLNLQEDTLEDRTDVLSFDEALEAKIRAFQTAQSLPITGTLNYETTIKLIDFYRTYREQSVFDLQLQNTIDYLVSYES